MKKQIILSRILCLIVVAILALVKLTPDPLARFSLPFEDLKYHVRAALGRQPLPDPATMIVAIDERSINALGRWPWERRVMARLLSRLAGADLVCLDMIFSETADTEGDAALGRAISENGNVIAGFFLRHAATQAATAAQLDLLHDSAYGKVTTLAPVTGVKEFPRAELNIPEVGGAALAQAFFTNTPDPDGLYRRYPVTYLFQGYYYPPLALQMVRYHWNREAELTLDRSGVRRFDLDRLHLADNSFALNFPDPDRTPMISAVDVLNDTIPASTFKNRLVLIGATEMGIYDLRPTPVDPVVPGVWLHYVALNNLLAGNFLKESPGYDRLLTLLTLLAIFLCGFAKRFRSRLGGYLLAIGLVMLFANGVHLYRDLWLHEFYPVAGGLLLGIGLEGSAFFFTEIRAGELKRAFVSYVSPEVVGEILENPERLELGGGEREISILFSDIRGFTTLSENVSPRTLVEMLTAIHNPMTGIVLDNKGMLDKYIGDAMMALFNTPVDLPDHATCAVRTALAMVESLTEINTQFARRGLPPIDIGVGVNSGTCIVGNMGSTFRFNYTAIGDAVNLASRLEGLCKTYHCRVVISEFTQARLSNEFVCRPLDRVRVKGKHEPVAIYQPWPKSAENERLCREAAAALELYFAGQFEEAEKGFLELAVTHRDPVAPQFAERCRAYLEKPPPPEWDGVHVLTDK